MARRNGMKKIQPAVKTLYFNVPTGQSFVDLSLVASAINRRFYRQGLNWGVSGFTFFNKGANTGNITISKLPDSWTVANSWVKGFALWNEMRDKVLEHSPSLKSRYSDFKIYANQAMAQASIQDEPVAGDGEILLPVSPDGGLLLKFGEWEYSSYVIPNDPLNSDATTEYKIHMIGDNVNTVSLKSKSLIMGYGFSRSRPQDVDPNIPDADDSQRGEDWMTDLFDVGDQEPQIREGLVDDNDQPPYRVGAAHPDDATNDEIYYVGGDQNLPALEFHDEVGFTSTTISSKNLMRGNNFPCGLVQIDNTIAGTDVYMQIHLVPGTHKGYLCQPMQEV